MGAPQQRSSALSEKAHVGPEYAGLALSFDDFSEHEQRWRRRNRTYYRLLTSIYRFLIPPGKRVLEVGSGTGDLLAALEPARGVGVDISGKMVALAREHHAALEFVVASGESFDAGETFDYIVLSDLVPYAHDLLGLFQNLHRLSHPRTRLILHSYSQLWRPVMRLAELSRMKPLRSARNWVAPSDVRNLLELAGFEPVSSTRRILFPRDIPVISTFLNGIAANLWPFSYLCLSYWFVARPRPEDAQEEPGVSVIVPCRNEKGMIAEIIDRVPEMGAGTEIVFVENGSTDGTFEEIERQIELHPERQIAGYVQPPLGKANAVRHGFDQAQNEILMILDADLTVVPEDLPQFYRVIASGLADFVNGSRLVYQLETGAMQFLNVVGNKLFSIGFSYVMDQPVKDTLCGTKVIRKQDYEAIAREGVYFSKLDPWGDFGFLLGAAHLGLKIVDLPIHYGARTYGKSKMSRFRHGWVLFQMWFFGFYRLKLAPVRL
jgi:SAM-dependent methyltransferase